MKINGIVLNETSANKFEIGSQHALILRQFDANWARPKVEYTAAHQVRKGVNEENNDTKK